MKVDKIRTHFILNFEGVTELSFADTVSEENRSLEKVMQACQDGAAMQMADVVDQFSEIFSGQNNGKLTITLKAADADTDTPLHELTRSVDINCKN